jgi:uncharacterized protein YndB with AHSA1/START domain
MQQVLILEKSIVINATPARLYKALTAVKELERWFCDRAESELREGGRVVHVHGAREDRGVYKRLIPNHEVAIEWQQHDHILPEDLTVYRLEKTPKGTRLTVVDFALPSEVEELNDNWNRHLKQLKKLYGSQPAARKPAAKPVKKKKAAAKKPVAKRRTAAKRKPGKATTRSPRQTTARRKRSK